MPIYEYRCDTNGRVVEVQHKMAERMATWGELCERAGIPPGNTANDAPVTKLMSAGFVNTGGASAGADLPPCQSGMPCCGGGACSMN